MDFETTETKANRHVSSQLLLLCAWRTSKEISLLLGQDLIPLLQDADDTATIIKISEFFKKQLAEIKHRGAFEQAYIGFCHTCDFMWKRSDSLKDAPRDMLKEIIDQLENNDEESKFCSTRRSAGIPFLVQAVVSTEPIQFNHRCLKEVLTVLIKMSRSDNPEVRIHSCNILRVLYRDSSLGEVVTPFVADGVKAAILGFKSTSWMVKNIL